MTDHIRDLSISRNESPFLERFTASEYGPLIWGQGAVNKNPKGNAAILGEGLIFKVCFSTKVDRKRHSTAPGGAVQFPCLYFFLLSWM